MINRDQANQYKGIPVKDYTQPSRFNRVARTVAGWLGAGALFFGAIGASEATGLTDQLVEANMVMHRGYHEAHKKAPLIFWGDPGDPYKHERFERARKRIGVDLELGLLGVIIPVTGVFVISEELEERRKNLSALEQA